MNMDGTIQDNTVFSIPFLSNLHREGGIFDLNGILVNILPILQAQAIAYMNSTFGKIAVYTTERENHKVKSNYENTVILKRYIFEFMDNYMCFFYIAFVNQDFASLKSQIVSYTNIKYISIITNL
jgi:anoctamin-10